MLTQIILSFVIFSGFASAQLALNEPTCGVKGPHSSGILGIVGGDDAAAFEFPWKGALLSNDGNDSILCGASILNRRWVITAAHCVCKHGSTQLNDVTKFVFLAGSLTLVEQNNQTINETVAYVDKFFRHPKYGIVGNYFVNDVALLKLNDSLLLSDPNKHLASICLPKEQSPNDLDNLAGNVCTTTGWGRTSFDGPGSDILQRVNITIQKQADCSQAFDGEVKIDDSMICAADPGKDTCEGDSGGPLICYDDGKWYLVGVTSWRFGCANPKYPGVYARVTEFLSWIKETISNN